MTCKCLGKTFRSFTNTLIAKTINWPVATEAGSSIENWKDTLKSITTPYGSTCRDWKLLIPEGPLHPYNTDDRDNGENNLTTTMLYMMDG